jgi:hypothetical protein
MVRRTVTAALVCAQGALALVVWIVALVHTGGARFAWGALAAAVHVAGGAVILARGEKYRLFVIRLVLVVLVVALAVGVFRTPSEVTALNLVWGFCVLALLLGEPGTWRVAGVTVVLAAFDALMIAGAIRAFNPR